MKNNLRYPEKWNVNNNTFLNGLFGLKKLLINTPVTSFKKEQQNFQFL